LFYIYIFKTKTQKKNQFNGAILILRSKMFFFKKIVFFSEQIMIYSRKKNTFDPKKSKSVLDPNLIFFRIFVLKVFSQLIIWPFELNRSLTGSQKLPKKIILPYSTRKLSSSSVSQTHKFKSIEPKKLFKTVITIPTAQNFFVKFKKFEFCIYG
jgi:hypothetical protein